VQVVDGLDEMRPVRQSRVAGRPVAYVDVAEGRAEQELVDAGAPAWLVTHLTGAIRLIRQGALEPATATVRAITGLEPRTFDVFAREHARFFAPPSNPAADPQPAAAQSQDLARLFVEQVNAGDLTGLQALYESDAVRDFHPATSPADTGPSATFCGRCSRPVPP
jgi:hypothetical protein